MASSSSSCRMLPVALGPLEAPTTFTTSSSCSASSFRPSPPRARRPRRVLYPACQSRRRPLREAPDQALRWLLLFSALVFLQIYTEETHTCTELQSQSPGMAASQPQEGDGSLCTVRGRSGEEPWRVQTVGGLQTLSWSVWWPDGRASHFDFAPSNVTKDKDSTCG